MSHPQALPPPTSPLQTLSQLNTVLGGKKNQRGEGGRVNALRRRKGIFPTLSHRHHQRSSSSLSYPADSLAGFSPLPNPCWPKSFLGTTFPNVQPSPTLPSLPPPPPQSKRRESLPAPSLTAVCGEEGELWVSPGPQEDPKSFAGLIPGEGISWVHRFRWGRESRLKRLFKTRPPHTL